VSEQQELLKALRESDDPTAFWHNEQPKCPHCGETFDVSENECWRLYEEGEHDIECNSCGLEFTVQTHVSFSYSTEDQP
jgi:transposase-like protein